MKATLFVITIIAFLATSSFSQSRNKQQILDASEKYYLRLQVFSINILEKIKPSISVDTTISKFRCFINNLKLIKIFLPSKKDMGILVIGHKEYLINLDESKFDIIREKDRKYTAYHKRYRLYPYVERIDFFSKLRKENLSVSESDAMYLLTGTSSRYEFDKTDYSLKKVIEYGYDKKYNSEWYKETNFSSCVENDSLCESYVERAIDIISKDKRESSFASEMHIVPKTFDRSILNEKRLRIINDSITNLRDKIIFLDFFYSSCIPCYKSHPLVNGLHENSDSNFIVIGVDPMLSDTLHINQFLERFNIKHPVIIGNDALEISRLPGVVNGYPTFLVIDKDGKVLEYQNGHSEKFLREIERKYLNKKKPENSKAIRGA